MTQALPSLVERWPPCPRDSPRRSREPISERELELARSFAAPKHHSETKPHELIVLSVYALRVLLLHF